MIKIAKAERTGDLTGIIRLIYETDDYIYPSMCGSDYKIFETVMQKLLITDSIFSYENIITACENNKTIGLLLCFEKDGKLPEVVSNYLNINKKQAADFDNVIQEYFKPLLSKIDDGCLYINNLCVNIENRRQGVATRLVDYLIKTFPNKKIVLDCLEENADAVNFYLKMGFKMIDRFLGYAGKQQEQINCIKLEYN